MMRGRRLLIGACLQALLIMMQAFAFQPEIDA